MRMRCKTARLDQAWEFTLEQGRKRPDSRWDRSGRRIKKMKVKAGQPEVRQDAPEAPGGEVIGANGLLQDTNCPAVEQYGVQRPPVAHGHDDVDRRRRQSPISRLQGKTAIVEQTRHAREGVADKLRGVIGAP